MAESIIGNKSLLIINDQVLDHITDNVRHSKVIDTITRYILTVEKWNSLKVYSNGRSHLAVTGDELNIDDNRSLPTLEPEYVFKDWMMPLTVSPSMPTYLTDVSDKPIPIRSIIANMLRLRGNPDKW